MFCDSKNDPDEKEPNKNICPICTGQPGTLPTINKVAVKNVLKTGLALGGELADFTEFDRKNYFYPDIPKGYQISQYKFPLVSGGELSGVKITRIHLEEDTGTSVHDRGSYSLVDFNRAGVPLMELVTEPVIRSAGEAALFARELQLLLRYLGVSEANMEKGEMRLEANVSVSSSQELGTKVEVKNLNSFRAVERAIEYEIERQTELLEKGEKVAQETRGWDENRGETFLQRAKEESQDYRYFPEPDLPKLYVSQVTEFDSDILKSELPELPWQRRSRLMSLGFLQEQDVEQLVGDLELANIFYQLESILVEPALVKIAANFVLNDIVGYRRKNPNWTPAPSHLAEVARQYYSGEISSPQAKLAIITGKIEASINKDALLAVVRKIIKENSKVVEDFRAGKEPALQFLIGQGMKELKGNANPKILRNMFLEELSQI